MKNMREEIDKAKDNYAKKQKAARARWDANADANAYPNHKPLTTNHKSNNQILFEEFWNIIRFKKGKEDAKKVFVKTFGCQMNVYDSDKIIDALKIIGYEKSAFIAKKAYKENRPIIDVAAEETDIPKAKLAKLLDPSKLAKGGI